MATYLPNITDVFPEPSLFTPDFSFMDKMLQRREQLYQQGFAQINSKFNWINRETTNPANAAIKEDFIKQARENLKNLAAMDLSQPQNVDAATNVFEPFVKNTNVLGDQAVTEHWVQQENIANGFRLRDGGKEFSEDNLNYIRQQRAAFAQDNPNSWGSYYGSRRFFSPYYDYYKEVQEKMKDFKPDNTSIMKMKGMYFITEKDASVRPSAVRRYLDAVLSDKAKQQMKIEAAVRLGTDKNALIGAYQTNANSQIRELDKEIGLVSTRMKVEKDPARKEQMKEYVGALEQSKDSYKRDLDNIKSNNMAPVLAKAEDMAFDIYFNKTVGKFANGYARKDYTFDISANSVTVDMWKDAQVTARQEDQQAHDKEMKMLELSGGLGAGSPFNMIITKEDDAGVAGELSDVRGKAFNISQQKRAAAANLTKDILNFYRNDGKTTAEDKLTEADLIRDPSLVQKFVNENGHLNVVEEYNRKMSFLNAENNLLEARMKAARTNAAANLTPEQQKTINDFGSSQEVASVGTVTVVDKGKFKNYSPKQIYDGLVKGTVTYTRKSGLGYLNIEGKEFLVGAGNIKGTDPIVAKAFEQINTIKSLVENNKTVSTALKSYNQTVKNELQVEPEYRNNKAQFIGDDTKAGKSLRDFIGGYLPTSKGTVSIQGVSQNPVTNRTYFSVSAGSDKAKFQDNSDINIENAKKILETKLAGQGIKVGTWSGGLYIENPNIIVDKSMSSFTETEKLMLQYDPYIEKTPPNQQPLYWYPLDRATLNGRILPRFRYEKDVDYGGNPRYYLFDDTGNGFLGGKVYSDLHQLMIDAKSYSLDPTSLELHKAQ